MESRTHAFLKWIAHKGGRTNLIIAASGGASTVLVALVGGLNI